MNEAKETSREYKQAYCFDFTAPKEDATIHRFEDNEGARLLVAIGKTRALVVQYLYSPWHTGRLIYPLHSWQALDSFAKKAIRGALDSSSVQVSADKELNRREKYSTSEAWTRHFNITTTATTEEQ